MTDRTETARALLYRHNLPEDVIDGALALHAQELAAVQRKAHDEQRPYFHSGLACQPGWGCGVRRIIDLIDPTLAEDAPSSAVVPAADRAALRDRIADVLADADGWRWVDDRDKARSSTYRSYQSRADAVLSVLPAAVDRVAAETPQPEGEPTESIIYEYEVVGDWGVDSADSAEGARAAVAKWLREYPKCGAYAQQRVVREWSDGSEFYGPWTDLPDAPAVPAQPGNDTKTP